MGQTAEPTADSSDLDPKDVYRRCAVVLRDASVPFLVGGAYAMAQYTPLVRDTKDIDLFLRPEHVRWAMEILERAGFQVTLPHPHWLAKAYMGPTFVDLIFSSGNGVALVDDEWFQHAPTAEVLGMQLLVCPAEEVIWSKAFVLERERFDGADVAHMIRDAGAGLDWQRLLRRFGAHWRVLLAHLVLFGFIYPGERDRVPAWVMRVLSRRLQDDLASEPGAAGRLPGHAAVARAVPGRSGAAGLRRRPAAQPRGAHVARRYRPLDPRHPRARIAGGPPWTKERITWPAIR